MSSPTTAEATAPVQALSTPETPVERIDQFMAAQKAYFASGATRPIDGRLKALKRLQQSIRANEQALMDGLYRDLHKAPQESYATEIGFVLAELRYTLRNLRSWARPEPVATPLMTAISSGEIRYEPYGQSLIIGAWNYPMQLCFAPLIGALSAGCTALIKPSEFTPHTNAVIEKIVREAFDEAYVAVVNGSLPTSTALLQRRHDVIFFTGSPAVGKVVMRAAAEYLTPVVLELGGKSPAIVDESVNLPVAAKRIAWGKWTNAGQTCVAPDYVLVHQKQYRPLLDELKKASEAFFGANPQNSDSYGRLVSDRHYQRAKSLMAGGTVALGGQTDDAERYIAPTVLVDVDPDSAVMQEEIFAPILPVIPYTNLEDALNVVNSKERPLSLYVFSNRRRVQEAVLNRTSAGGGCINDTMMHLAAPDLPFGGNGHSGLGKYHGKHSFLAFSNSRAVMKKALWLDPSMRYAPFTKGKFRMLRWFAG